MLESLAATLLNRLLGSYVENFDPDQLKVGIWSGDVQLRNLTLRKDCLDSLDLPVDVKYGVLGDLVLNVPWSSLKNKPVNIFIQDCYLLCIPRDLHSYYSQESLEREFRQKLKKLMQWELANKARKSQTIASKTEGSENESFMQSLITKVIDNIQISIKDIHIRYEDSTCIFSPIPSSIGISLHELSAVSTDSNWTPKFIETTQSITHKLLTLDSLSIYWNTETNEFVNMNDVDPIRFLESFRQYNDDNRKSYQYLLKPVTGMGKLSINKLGTTEAQPHLDLQLICNQFGLELDDAQYSSFLHFISILEVQRATQKLKKNRPTYTVTENPRGWFKYVASCVHEEIHEKNTMWTWSHIKKAADSRKEYIDLWMEKLRSGDIEKPLSNTIKEECLINLEKDLNFDTIVLYRSIANGKYIESRLASKEGTPTSSEPSLPQPNQETKPGTWISSWWSGDAMTTQQDNLVLTEEQKKELYDAIEFNDQLQSNLKNKHVDRHLTQMRVTGLLRKGFLILKNKEKNVRLGTMTFQNCNLEFQNREDSSLTNFKLQEFKVEDGSPNSVFKDIICSKEVVGDNDTTLSEPLFQVLYESNPLDGLADSRVDLRLLGTTVFYHVHFISEIMRFFKPKSNQMDSVTAIINAASTTVESWTTQTRMGIESLLDEHKTVDLNLDLQAPLIIIPLNPFSWKTPCALIDAGHISIVSDLVSKEKISEIKEMSPSSYDKIDGSDINRLMFDRFTLKSQNTQILIGSDITDTLDNLNKSSSGNRFYILEKMQLDIIIDVSILPKALRLPRIRISGHLPKLFMAFNDYQYKIFLDLARNIIPPVNDFDVNADYYESKNGQLSSEEQQLEQENLRATVESLTGLSELELEQKFLDIHFDVDEAQFSLHQCSDINTMENKKLIDLVFTDYNFTFEKMMKQINVNMSVHSVAVEDHIVDTDFAEFRTLISSELNSKKGNIMTIEYKRTQRIVTHEDSLIEVYDQDIFISATKMKLILTPKSILSLMNYMVLTFTDPNAPEVPADLLKHNDENHDDSPQQLKLKFKYEGMDIILNDDSMKLATFTLSSGEYDLLLLPESMKFNMNFDGVELVDEINEGVGKDSVFRKLISMNNQDLVGLRYEKYDATTNKNNYDSMLVLSAGAMFINFNKESIRRIVLFLKKFQKMKTYFDSLRQAAYNQAPSFSTVNNMKVNVSVKAPIIQFPRLTPYTKDKVDSIKFYLGEIFIENDFIESSTKNIINHIKLGLRDGQIASLFHLKNNISQDLYIADGMCINFDISHNQEKNNISPVFKILGKLDPLSLNVTELQLSYLFDIINLLEATFILPDEEILTSAISTELSTELDTHSDSEYDITGTSSLSPDPSSPSNLSDGEHSTYNSIDFKFSAPSISLALYDNTDSCSSIEKKSLTKVMIQDMASSIIVHTNGSSEGNAHIASFTVKDTRDNKDNKHPELIQRFSSEEYQFSASVSRKIVSNKLITNISSTIHNPRIILALDHIFAIKRLYDTVMAPRNSMKQSSSNAPAKVISDLADTKDINNSQESSTWQYSFNVIDAAIILLANPSELDSEAVVFRVDQFLFTEQTIISLSANNIGMFLSRINDLEKNKVRLIDNFSSSLIIDRRDTTPQKLLTKIHASVEPLVMRISLRDIRLAILIFNNAISLMDINKIGSKDETNSEMEGTKGIFSKEFERHMKKYIPSLKSVGSETTDVVPLDSMVKQTSTGIILKGEAFDADFGGCRIILLGDVHEMPIIETQVGAFTINASDWSTAFDGSTNIEAAINVFNYSRSSWEPLVESVPIGLYIKRGTENTSSMKFDIIARKNTEITLSSRAIAMLSSIPKSLNGEVHLTPRGSKKPYRLINDSGLDLKVWISDSANRENREGLVYLKANSTEPWEFEDWKSIRERLDTDRTKSILGVNIDNSAYTSTMTIDATFEGELLHVLHPAVDQVHNRIICELKCNDDNVKDITFRSTLLLENITGIPLNFRVVKLSDDKTVEFQINPSESRSVPVEYAYASNIYVQPVTKKKFGWSCHPIVWKKLLDVPASIDCDTVDENDQDQIFFEVNAKYDKREPLAKIYPHMKITVSPSIIIENLLPCDIDFSIFSKQAEIRNIKHLAKSEKMTVYDVSLNEFLLLAIKPLVDDTPMSKPSIINTPKKSQLQSERAITLRMPNGQQLQVYLKYLSIEGSRAKTIKIYSPYIIMNCTDRDLYMEGSFGNILQSKISVEDGNRFTIPKMFSYDIDGDKNNRARIRFRETDWSTPLSLDAIGQSFDVTMGILNKALECNLGIDITEGTGKYSLSKVVTISPRYIVKNELPFPIVVCETGSVNSTEMTSGGSVALYNLRNIVNKQLVLKMLGSNSEWTAPFFIKDIGLTYLKLLQEDGTHMLLKLEVTLNQATIFVRIKDGENLWPYSIRNFSDNDFIFYQRDPSVIDEYYDVEPEEEKYNNEYKPLYYKVPAKSVMPYAWDYPTARQKKIVLLVRGRKREIQLAEIGTQKPMRLPARVANEQPAIVDLNVIADGPTQALVISKYDPISSIYKLRDVPVSSNNSLTQARVSSRAVGSSPSLASTPDLFETEEEDNKIIKSISINIAGFGVSLINKQLKELAYVSVKGLELTFKDSDLYQTFGWKIKWMQVDNQIFGSVYQNVLYPTAITKSTEDLDSHPIFSGSISKVKDDSFGLPYFKHLTFLLQEFSIQLDEDWVYAMIDYMKFPGSPLYSDLTSVPLKERNSLPKVEELNFSNDVYFEMFHIQPTILHLSFVSSEDTKSGEDEENENGSIDEYKDNVDESSSASVFLLHVLTMTVGNVNDAPIKLNALFLDNVRVPIPLLMQSVKTHYSQQFFYQIHMILGSADFLGNPVGLFNTISSGVWDLFYEPYQGYMLNDRPQDIGVFIAKGGLSFAKKTVFGLSDSMAKMSGSMAKGLSVTQDSDFQATRKLQQRMNANSRNVFSTSAQSFASTLGSGFAGVALEPLKGGQREGASGFFKGLGKGLVSLPTKTAIGFLDLTNNLSQGVKSSTTILQAQNDQSVRLPRYVNQDQIIRQYDLRAAQGQYWLKSANGGLFQDDRYLAHTVLPGKELSVIVSMERITEIRMATQEVMWGIEYHTIQGITLERGGIRIKLKTQSEYFIPIEDPQEKRSIYKSISIAVVEYNKFCEAVL
ncbi:similar to Saccharomyces cerevisiae YLL040C VPS13 Protein of unknown function [Maudiozyma saulgeensis]|uniref:Vacuolar protein sorting-associated protein n=1 Tax=Maudiozyma saulgeensis TaxID=1789683 RepID=A0A1X7RBD9_9SACH|nr:similar to Saccharomyces cerevisiae YLL040C VPS13 Protein of unknown function [Kazachstania saulgeensis]